GNAENDEELRRREAATHDESVQGRRAPGVSRPLMGDSPLFLAKGVSPPCCGTLVPFGLFLGLTPFARKQGLPPFPAFAKPLVCVESALFFGRPGRDFPTRGRS